VFFIAYFPVDASRMRAFVRPSARGSVAQLVEQRTENPCVTGSIPVRATSVVIHCSSVIGGFLFCETRAELPTFFQQRVLVYFVSMAENTTPFHPHPFTFAAVTSRT
jgi:hypothetical protein